MVKQISRVGIVHEALRTAIVEQALEPGAKLPEDAIGEQFGVSRTIVRRALERLAAEELVVILPNRGASVARPSLEQAQDLFRVRMDMEDALVRRVCGKLSAKDVARLRDCVAREHEAHRQQRPDYIRLSAEFHIVLAELAGSPLLLRYMRQLVGQSALVLRLYGRPNWDACNVDEHRRLIATLKSGEVEACRQLMAAHLEAVLTRALDGAKLADEPSLQAILGRYAGRTAP